MDRIFKITPTLQTYAWGGNGFIPELIGRPYDPVQTYAELWMGDHSKSPSRLPLNFDVSDLNRLIRDNPEIWLGKGSLDKFGNRLPFLFKVLDVKKMLSIQVHPNKADAEAGFKREESHGISIDSHKRTFKDDNHKPELMVALSPFWLLHGFRPTMEIKSILTSTKSLQDLSILLDRGVRRILEYILRSPDEIIVQLLQNLRREILQLKDLDRFSPHYWVKKAFLEHGLDRGVLFIYLLNLVYLEPGQAIYQAAGMPHAYLEGKNIEIMANSDNVIRGGLTKKFTNVDLLMEHLLFDPVIPQIISGIPDSFGMYYPAPIDDFSLYRVRGEGQQAQFAGASILFVYSGSGRMINNTSMEINKGDVIYICPNEPFELLGVFTGFFATSII